MDIDSILKKVEQIAEPALAGLGYELIERELLQESGRWVLRLYIDKEGGVTIDDCERASHGVEDVIEVEEVVPCAYCLELSSPGINRPLRRAKDFEKYLGSQIRLKTNRPIDNRSNYKGTLKSFDGEKIVMVVDGMEFFIPFDALGKARIEPETIKNKN